MAIRSGVSHQLSNFGNFYFLNSFFEGLPVLVVGGGCAMAQW